MEDISLTREPVAQSIQLVVAVVATIALAGCYVAPAGYGYSQLGAALALVSQHQRARLAGRGRHHGRARRRQLVARAARRWFFANSSPRRRRLSREHSIRRIRLETLRDEKAQNDPAFAEQLVEGEDIADDLLDEILSDDEAPDEIASGPIQIDRPKLRDEIDVLQQLATWARAIEIDTKSHTLLQALEIGFEQMTETGAARKALKQHDVIVINFLNERNEADKRVLDLLTEKFELFDGVFGASDEVLGTIEVGVDFEKRIPRHLPILDDTRRTGRCWNTLTPTYMSACD
jgi:hypothetical protein